VIVAPFRAAIAQPDPLDSLAPTDVDAPGGSPASGSGTIGGAPPVPPSRVPPSGFVGVGGNSRMSRCHSTQAAAHFVATSSSGPQSTMRVTSASLVTPSNACRSSLQVARVVCSASPGVQLQSAPCANWRQETAVAGETLVKEPPPSVDRKTPPASSPIHSAPPGSRAKPPKNLTSETACQGPVGLAAPKREKPWFAIAFALRPTAHQRATPASPAGSTSSRARPGFWVTVENDAPPSVDTCSKLPFPGVAWLT